MGPRQTAVNTLGYSTGSRPKAEAGRGSAKRSEPASANVHAAVGPGAGRGWTNGGQGRSAAVGQAPKQVSSTPNHRGFRPTDGATKTWSGRIL
jgi:hypothetical protein